ncbi:uncharacterized protein LOC122278667 [Carya illinoinensis]|uniref:uncharacterized protein LOC122278667 n=1 Tax=Carya illinoinensis TaxID=32201 RepID=UPI001C719066|nr:uncharacterized protein LOC122278667 [Carya illinoinensis]
MNLHYQLAILKASSSSISNYFHKFTTLVDTLATADQPLNEFELVSFLVAGLGSQYDSFVTSLTTRVDPIFLEDLYGHMLAHELSMEHYQTSTNLTLGSANTASHSHGFCGGRSGHASSSSPTGHGFGCSNRGRSYGLGPTSPSDFEPVCQVCNKVGHTALSCHHWYDESYERDPSPMQAYCTGPSQSNTLNWLSLVSSGSFFINFVTPTGITLVLVYVDVILVAGNDIS